MEGSNIIGEKENIQVSIMQRKKNIRLFIILLVLCVVTVFVSLSDSGTKEDLDKKLFVIPNTDLVKKIEIERKGVTNVLTLDRRQWKLNKKYTADLAKINDLFVILGESSVRRKAAQKEQIVLKKKIKDHGAFVKVYDEPDILTSFYVLGNDKGTLTYFMKENGEAYVVNIPGHNYQIADLFELNTKGWRTRYVFASNWTTLEKMEIKYPINNNEGFSINYDKSGYYIPGITELDTVAMYGYLEQVSYLQVKDFVSDQSSTLKEPLLQISVQDVGENAIKLNFFTSSENQIIGQIDSKEWAEFYASDVAQLMKSKQDFESRKDE